MLLQNNLINKNIFGDLFDNVKVDKNKEQIIFYFQGKEQNSHNIEKNEDNKVYPKR